MIGLLLGSQELNGIVLLADAQKPAKTTEPGGISYNSIINCDDEEDCIAGSGSGDGPTNNVFTPTGSEANGADGRIEIWYPEGTDSEFKFLLLNSLHQSTFSQLLYCYYYYYYY